MDIIETIKDQIANNTILLYMKGSPNAPQCGFSAKAAQAVMGCGEPELQSGDRWALFKLQALVWIGTSKAAIGRIF